MLLTWFCDRTSLGRWRCWQGQELFNPLQLMPRSDRAEQSRATSIRYFRPSRRDCSRSPLLQGDAKLGQAWWQVLSYGRSNSRRGHAFLIA